MTIIIIIIIKKNFELKQPYYFTIIVLNILVVPVHYENTTFYERKKFNSY